MSIEWSDETDGSYIDGSYWGARVWPDEGDGMWYWEAWSDGDEESGAASDNADGEENSKVKAKRCAEKFLSSLRVDFEAV